MGGGAERGRPMELRELLDWMQDVPTMDEYLERLRVVTQAFPNTIRQLEDLDPDANYSCYTYALHLAGSPEYEAVKDLDHNKAWACSLFADWLLKHDVLKEVTPAKATIGHL